MIDTSFVVVVVTEQEATTTRTLCCCSSYLKFDFITYVFDDSGQSTTTSRRRPLPSRARPLLIYSSTHSSTPGYKAVPHRIAANAPSSHSLLGALLRRQKQGAPWHRGASRDRRGSRGRTSWYLAPCGSRETLWHRGAGFCSCALLLWAVCGLLCCSCCAVCCVLCNFATRKVDLSAVCPRFFFFSGVWPSSLRQLPGSTNQHQELRCPL